MTTPLTKNQFIDKIRSYSFDADLENVLITMINDAPEVTDELIHAVADVAEMHNENMGISAELLLQEADILENLALELDTIAEEQHADELESIYADLVGADADPHPAQVEPGEPAPQQPATQQSTPAPEQPSSLDEKAQLQSYIDSLKTTPAE